MTEMTPGQATARKSGVAQGIREEFAIDCTAIAITDVTIRTILYRAGSKDVRIYDSRVRDKLRKARAIMVTKDAWLTTAVSATIPTVKVEEMKGTLNDPEERETPDPAPGALPEGGPVGGEATG